MLTPAYLLLNFARKYIWWKTPQEATQKPDRIIAQVMELGEFEDVQVLLDVLGEEKCREVILHAEPGLFSPKSWHYWHYRLAICKPNDRIPDMPKRIIK